MKIKFNENEKVRIFFPTSKGCSLEDSPRRGGSKRITKEEQRLPSFMLPTYRRDADHGTFLRILEHAKEVQEAAVEGSFRAKEKEVYNGCIGNIVGQKFNAGHNGHGEVEFEFRSADNDFVPRKSQGEMVFEAQLLKALSQVQSRPRKRPRSNDRFNLDEILGLNQAQRVTSFNKEVPVNNNRGNLDLNVRASPVSSSSGQQGSANGGGSDTILEVEDNGISSLNATLENEIWDTVDIGSLVGVDLQGFRDKVRDIILEEGINGVYR
ncbi:hypothetical protein L1987_18338 [Smallanthus sonchifolius]|uniref:Uncharacterized protein n=1 Tax=Smallanthus sonchifolius TaxID=185202 RepID=A0ACB9J1G8_9ASTR|nr:hypothetical protein L1987_18338 [Smallanthus sonchifolius]